MTICEGRSDIFPREWDKTARQTSARNGHEFVSLFCPIRGEIYPIFPNAWLLIYILHFSTKYYSYSIFTRFRSNTCICLVWFMTLAFDVFSRQTYDDVTSCVRCFHLLRQLDRVDFMWPKYSINRLRRAQNFTCLNEIYIYLTCAVVKAAI